MTTTHNFLPGDRVIYKGGAREFEGWLGTIVEPLTPEGPIAVKFDHDFPRQMTRSWSNDRYLEPAPITVGAWVRIIGPTPAIVAHYSGKVSKVIGVDSLVTIERISEEHWCQNWTAENLRVVATDMIGVYPPKPQFMGLDLASGPDKSYLQVVGRGMRMVVDKELSTHALKQAQQLVRSLYKAHYSDMPMPKVGDDLVTCLSQIDNMTAGLVRHSPALNRRDNRIAELEAQIKALTGSDERHAAEVKRLQGAIDEMAAHLRIYQKGSLHSWVVEWIAKYAPEPTPQFKRGDLVTWGAGCIAGRIIGHSPSKNAPFEVIITEGGEKQIGHFHTPDLATLRHVQK